MRFPSMSKILPPTLSIFASFALFLQFFTIAQAQDIDIRLKVATDKRVSAEVRIRLAANAQPEDLWFMDEYAGITGLLTDRISPVHIYDKQGYLVARKRLALNEIVTSNNHSGYGYTVDLKPRLSAFAAAHASWATDIGGVLMLDDLLPQSIAKTVNINLELPAGWKAASTDYPSSMDQSDPSDADRNRFSVVNVGKSVIFIGREDRRRVVWSGKARLVFNLRDEWQFNVDEGLSAAASIFAGYEEIFGSASTGSFLIGINKFPSPVSPGNWEADTRGRTVTLVSSDTPFKSQSLQRLHEQLRHELFHLWIPNRVNLSGNYDWFYEGFALYQSLKTGVAINSIRFDDYLDTLARAYDIDQMQPKKLSLIEAAKNRWSGSNTQIYARGMLVAFLCDLALIQNSKGKSSVPTLLREVFDNHGPSTQTVDGNAAVIAILQNHPELVPIVERYILGAHEIDWLALLKTTGIEHEVKDQLTKLKVVAKPSGRQKDLLDRLGYNNWRKLSQTTR